MLLSLVAMLAEKMKLAFFYSSLDGLGKSAFSNHKFLCCPHIDIRSRRCRETFLLRGALLIAKCRRMNVKSLYPCFLNAILMYAERWMAAVISLYSKPLAIFSFAQKAQDYRKVLFFHSILSKPDLKIAITGSNGDARPRMSKIRIRPHLSKATIPIPRQLLRQANEPRYLRVFQVFRHSLGRAIYRLV